MKRAKINIPREELAAMIEDGKSQSEIAKHFGCSQRTISTRITKWGLQRWPAKYEFDMDELRRMYEVEGMTTYEIAHHFGVAQQTIYSRLSEVVDMRKRKARPGVSHGANSANWLGGVHVTDAGYIRVRLGPNHERSLISNEPRTNRTIRMHQLVAFSRLGIEIDHENNDKLDNRAKNLRPATKMQQMQNRGSVGAIEYKGVSTNATGEPVSRIHYYSRQFGLGTYPSFEAAALAFDAFASHFYGEYAYLNFPDMTPLHPKVAQQLRTPRSRKRGGDRYEVIRKAIAEIQQAA